jgi:hypothetical protein
MLDVAVLESVNRDAKSVGGWLNLSLHHLSLTPHERLQYGLNSTCKGCCTQVGNSVPATSGCSSGNGNGTGTAPQELQTCVTCAELANKSSSGSGSAMLNNADVVCQTVTRGGVEEKTETKTCGGSQHEHAHERAHEHEQHLGDEIDYRKSAGKDGHEDGHGYGKGKDSSNLFRLLVDLPSMIASSFSPTPKGKSDHAHAHAPSATATVLSERASTSTTCCASTIPSDHKYSSAWKMEQVSSKDMQDVDGGNMSAGGSVDMRDVMLPKGEVVFIDGYHHHNHHHQVQQPLRGQLFLDGEELLIPGASLRICAH